MGRLGIGLLLAMLTVLAGTAQAAAQEASSGGGAAANPAPLATTEPQVLLMGRFWPGPGNTPSASLPQLMSWPASSAIVSFSGASSVTVVINGSLQGLSREAQLLAYTREFPWSVFQFELDGEVVDEGETSPEGETPVLTWRQGGLSQGQHTLTITKLGDPHYGEAWLQSISLDPSSDSDSAATFLTPPPSPGMQSGRRMLFIGDSYTAGSGITDDASCEGTMPYNQDATLAYGPTAARSYEADYQLLAWGGAGLVAYPKRGASDWPQDRQLAAAPTMRDLLYRADGLTPSRSYSLASWVPQVVVLAAGTNDFADAYLSEQQQVQSDDVLPPLQQWLDEYEALVWEVQGRYPDAGIITMAWPLEVQLAGVRTLEQTVMYLQYMAAAATRLQTARVPNTYFLQLTGEEFDNSDWCSGHPNAATAAQVASQLIQFIDAVLPDFGNSTFAAVEAAAALPPPAQSG